MSLWEFWQNLQIELAAAIILGLVVLVWRLFIKKSGFVILSKNELRDLLGEKTKQINYNKNMGDTYNISSNKQSGGFTGVLNVDKQRRLNEKLKNQLVEVIPNKDYIVKVTAVLGDGEAIQFAGEIKDYLGSSGYRVEGVNQAIYTSAPKGQMINKKDDKTIEIIVGHKE